MPFFSKKFHFRSILFVIALICLLGSIAFIPQANASDSDNTKLPAWQFTSELEFTILIKNSEEGCLELAGRTPGTVKIPECTDCIFWVSLDEANIADYAEEIKTKKIKRLCFWSVDDSKLTSLKKTGCLEYIENFELVGKLSDLKLLENLKNLKGICLTDQVLSDLKPLAKLTSLESLSIQTTKVKDLSSLEGLTNLKSLGILGSDLENITALARLEKLEDLSLLGCFSLKDLTPLVHLKKLKRLVFLSCFSVKDLTPLASLSRLEYLSFSECHKISSLSPLANLQNLKILELTHMNKLDLTTLTGPKSLEQISFCGNSFSDLTPLTKTKNLKEISFHYCHEITDLTPLTNLQHLEKLDFYSCYKLSNLTPLGDLKHLRFLHLSGNQKISETEISTLQKKLPTLKIEQ